MTDVVAPANSPPQTFGGQYGAVQPDPNATDPTTGAQLPVTTTGTDTPIGQAMGQTAAKVVTSALSNSTMLLIFLFVLAAAFIMLGSWGVMQSQDTVKRVAGGIVA